MFGQNAFNAGAFSNDIQKPISSGGKPFGIGGGQAPSNFANFGSTAPKESSKLFDTKMKPQK